MKDLNELKDNYDSNTWKTIVLSKKNYEKLREWGYTSESFNTVVGRLLERLDNRKEED